MKSITQASFFGILSGSLLASTTLLWLNSEIGMYLPILVAVWWFIIFGLNLWHSYQLSFLRLSSIKRFGLQFAHASLAAVVYFSIDFAIGDSKLPEATTQQVEHLQLHAQASGSIDALLTNSFVIVGAAFVLSLVTGGLLYSIISRPAAK